jgi:hypothetical protein
VAPHTFVGATFAPGADFNRVRFHGHGSLYWATLLGDIDFAEAVLGSADFNGVRFRGAARFWRAGFEGTATFYLAQFADEADFYGASFGSDAVFMNARFAGTVSFRDLLSEPGGLRRRRHRARRFHNHGLGVRVRLVAQPRGRGWSGASAARPRAIEPRSAARGAAGYLGRPHVTRPCRVPFLRSRRTAASPSSRHRPSEIRGSLLAICTLPRAGAAVHCGRARSSCETAPWALELERIYSALRKNHEERKDRTSSQVWYRAEMEGTRECTTTLHQEGGPSHLPVHL